MANVCRFVLLFGFCSSLVIRLASSAELNVTAFYGQTAVLVCPNSTDITITFWTGPPEEHIYNYPNSILIISTLPQADRLEINETNAALLIHNVTLEDEGIYKCTADSVTSSLQLVVTNVAPTSIFVDNIEEHEGRTIIQGKEDRNITMTCSADGGKPKPNVTWTRPEGNWTYSSNVSVYEHSNGTFAVFSVLTFVAGRRHDRTVFTCTIEHQALEYPVMQTVEVYLELKPQVADVEGEVTVEGFNATIRCEVFDARPAANISIYFDGTLLSDFEKNIVIYNKSSETYSTSASMYRVMDRHDDRKKISCIINHVALDNAVNKSWSIAVHYPPTATISGRNVSSKSGSVSLECVASGGNPADYAFSLWQHKWLSYNTILRELQSTNSSANYALLKLENLTFQDSGYYKCFVTNGIRIPQIPDYRAEQDILIFVSDIPLVVDGRSQYHSDIDEKIGIVLDVYANVEPLSVSIEGNMNNTGTTAIWTIKENTMKTVGVPVYNQKILMSGFRVSADFEVQAETNYGDYKVIIRNDVGSTSHEFKVLPRGVPTTSAPGGQEGDQTNFVPIVLGTVIPCVVIVFVVAMLIYYKGKADKARSDSTAKTPGKRYIHRPREPGNPYDYINPGGEGYINPMGEGKSSDAKDEGYLEPRSPSAPTFKAEYWEYHKGDEKVIYKKIEGKVPDQIDCSGSMKLPSLPMSESPRGPESSDDYINEGADPMNSPSLTIEEMPEMTIGYVDMSGSPGQPVSTKNNTTDIEEVD